MLGRIIGGLAIAIASYVLIKRLKRWNSDQQNKAVDREEREQLASTALVRCSQCGVNIPANQARQVGDGFQCLNPSECGK
jgi:hypothetical protein